MKEAATGTSGAKRTDVLRNFFCFMIFCLVCPPMCRTNEHCSFNSGLVLSLSSLKKAQRDKKKKNKINKFNWPASDDLKRSVQIYAKVGYDGPCTSRGRIYFRCACESHGLIFINRAGKRKEKKKKKLQSPCGQKTTPSPANTKAASTTKPNLFGFTLEEEKKEKLSSPRGVICLTSLLPWTSFFFFCFRKILLTKSREHLCNLFFLHF